jgi:hypothetical protein
MLDPGMVLIDVVTIADECDAQLNHTVGNFCAVGTIQQAGGVRRDQPTKAQPFPCLFNFGQFCLGLIQHNLLTDKNGAKMTQTTESVATVLERETTPLIERWMQRVDKVPALTHISLTKKERTGHLPQLMEDLIVRLRLEKGVKGPETTSAHDHGQVRFEQGYSAPMLVEESLLLQVTIFDTLRREQKHLDSNTMLEDVVTIADECDTQLKHSMETFTQLEEERDSAAA